MTKKSGLIAAAWALSCGSAFLIGRTSTTGTAESQASENQTAPALSSRSSKRGENYRANGSSQNRRSSSREFTPSSPAQLAALEEKVRNLKSLSDPLARAEGFLELVQNLGPDEFLTAVAAFREGGIGNEQFGEYRLLLNAWAQINPLEALDYAKENTGTAYARQTILAAWAKNDSESAVSWARENFEDNGEENRANPWIVGIISGLASTDTGRATQLLEELPLSRGRGEALESIFKEVIAGGHDDAKRWIAQLTDPSLQQGAASRLAGRLAEEDPQGAADWAASLGPDVIKRAAGTIIANWAEQDLSSARTWIDSQPTDIAAAAGPNLITRMIQQEDLSAATTWLQDFAGEPAFDNSIRSLVRGSMREQPDLAADWIMQLSSPNDQVRTFHRVLEGWLAQDRDGAINYIQNNEVPESVARRAGITK